MNKQPSKLPVYELARETSGSPTQGLLGGTIRGLTECSSSPVDEEEPNCNKKMRGRKLTRRSARG